MKSRRDVALWLMVVAAVLAACTAPATTVFPTAAPAKPTVPAVPASAVPPPGPTGIAAEALLNERCSTCHNLDRVKAARKSAEDWKASVQRMVSKGARLSTEEVDALVAYLAATYK